MLRLHRYPRLLLLLASLLAPQGSHSQTPEGLLSYSRSLEAFRQSPSHWPSLRPRGTNENVDVVDISENATDTTSFVEQLQDKAICHVLEMNRYSFPAGPGGSRINFPSTYPLESLAAVVMAVEHLNTGDGTVVPEIGGLNERCRIRFTSEFVDTAGLENEAVDQVINAIQRVPPEQQPPCAFLGAFRGKVNIATALYTSLKGYPQVSTLTSAPELDNKEIYPLYGSLNPSNVAKPFLEFLVEVLKINHLAVVHADNTDGLKWVNPLRETAAKHYPGFHVEAVGYSEGTTDFESTVATLKKTGIRYVYNVANTYEYPDLVREAHKQGIAGNTTDPDGTPCYTWITWVGIAQTFLLNKEFEPNDPIFESGRNTIILDSTVRSIPGVGRYNEYLEARQKLADHPEDLAFLRSKVPRHPDQPGYDPSFAPEVVRGIGRFSGTAATLYDATVALGLGACAAAEVYGGNAFDGATHYEGFLNVSFVGASGLVELDPTTGSRDARSNIYAMYNMVPTPVGDTGNWTMAEVKTHVYNEGAWNQREPIRYIHGSDTPHPDLPPATVDTNTIGTVLRSIGLALGGLVLLSSIGCAVWTLVNGDERIVTASQPIFLLLIAFGTFLMGTATIPLSLDDQVVEEVDAACMAVPWMLCLGWCFAFSALFSKTRRVNIIFHNPSFRRVKVDAVDVMRPMLVLLGLNIVLLGVWTGVAPLEWTRTVVDYDVFGRPSESVGKCDSDSAWWFLLPLIVINLGALVYAIQQAYAARKIATEFAESDWIARAMSFIVLVSFVTIPVIVIAEENTSAAYFVEVALVFVICMSVLGFVFGPKMWANAKRQSVTQESIAKTMKRCNTQSTASAMTGVDMSVSNHSSYEGALILEHPKQNEDMKAELQELKKMKLEWEKERNSATRPHGAEIDASESDAVSTLGPGSGALMSIDGSSQLMAPVPAQPIAPVPEQAKENEGWMGDEGQ